MPDTDGSFRTAEEAVLRFVSDAETMLSPRFVEGVVEDVAASATVRTAASTVAVAFHVRQTLCVEDLRPKAVPFTVQRDLAGGPGADADAGGGAGEAMGPSLTLRGLDREAAVRMFCDLVGGGTHFVEYRVVFTGSDIAPVADLTAQPWCDEAAVGGGGRTLVLSGSERA